MAFMSHCAIGVEEYTTPFTRLLASSERIKNRIRSFAARWWRSMMRGACLCILLVLRFLFISYSAGLCPSISDSRIMGYGLTRG